ncbi:uncharacterized protein LOC127835789 [Dreissena polymorpha]|uniref:uncharacterized protein LOC127835789 n=1 Tax=Dreissena polymorpha TaxID=45954 RepID=UPI002263B959|nr:uncharacterized protein LOC127835789 [Dreissena polymorpha]
MNTVSVLPLWLGLDKPIFDIFVQPKFSLYNIEKDGSRYKTNKAIYQYKDFFYNDIKLKRVFVQGDPGIGKSTFLTKLVIDWCNAVSCCNPDNKATFSDADTLKDFQFLFHISLRDAKGQREVVEMIKTQIIDNIFTGAKQTKAFELLHQILERETCLVTMDGLNEWTDHLNQHVVPRIPSSHTNCVSLITTRPWKMADERIKVSVIDRLLEIEGITDSEKLTKQLIVSLQTANKMTHTDFMTYVNEHHFMHFFTSPWLQELIVNVWMSKTDVKGSLCEINCILLDSLFKNANATEGSFKNGYSIECLSSTRYIKKQMKIFDALANAAFQFTFSSNTSLTFSEQELRKYLSKKQLQFCLKAGVLTARFHSVKVAQGSKYSFTHETVHEFLAAFHIANSQQDLIANFKPEHKYSVLEMSQTIIYLYGLQCETANKLLNRLVDDEFFNDISNGLSLYMKHYSENLSAFQIDKYTKETVLKSKRNDMNYDARCLAISVLFQHMVIAGFNEPCAEECGDDSQARISDSRSEIPLHDMSEIEPCAEECGDDSQARISDSRSKIPLHDMSEIELFVKNGSSCAEECGDDSQARISDSRSEIPLHDMSEIEWLVGTSSDMLQWLVGKISDMWQWQVGYSSDMWQLLVSDSSDMCQLMVGNCIDMWQRMFDNSSTMWQWLVGNGIDMWQWTFDNSSDMWQWLVGNGIDM